MEPVGQVIEGHAGKCLGHAGARSSLKPAPRRVDGPQSAAHPCGKAAFRQSARLFRLTAEKGALAIGLDADIAVFAERPRIYDAAASGHNVVGWSPYEGRRIRHAAIATFLRGQMIYDGKDVLAEPGTGRFVKPSRPAQMMV